MVKNVTYDFMKNCEETLKNFGIVEIIEMKNKIDGRLRNFVKIRMANEDVKNKLLNERFIRIALFKIYIEDFAKPPTQCRKCKSFGHIEKNCKSVQKYGECTGNHSEDE